MANSTLNIGAKVHSSDGEHVGDLDQLVVDADARTISHLIVDKSAFNGGRIIPVQAIASTDEKGVTLNVTKAQVEQMPEYIEREMVSATGSLTYSSGAGMVDVGTGGSGNWMLVGGGGGDLPQTGASGLVMQAPIGEVVTQEVTSLTESSVRIDEGTDVVCSDGKKIGEVDEVLFDASLKMTGFLVKGGKIFHHDLMIPIDWVAGVASSHVRLNVSSSEAEKAKVS